MQKALIPFLFIICAQAWGQPVATPAAPVPLFTISKQPYLSDEFTYLYKKNHQNKGDFTEAKINDYFNLFLNFKLKVTEAKARGMDTTLSFRTEFKTYKEELKKPYLAEKDEIDRLSQEAYERLTEEVRASHILLSLKPDAPPEDTLKLYNRVMDLRNRAIAGEDFGKLAGTYSEDPSARSNHGDLGYFTALQMVYPFETAAFRLKPGEVSMPVRTRFGYHLIKVISRQPARGEVEIAHIILRSGTPNDAKLKNKIFEIYDQLQGGRSWDELCKEYSDDPGSKNTGGKLKPFGVGAMANVPEFEKQAFALKQPGDISDPFQTSYGWHLIKLEKKIPLPPYSEMETSLKRKISRDERLQYAKKKLLESQKKEFAFNETPGAMKVVLSLVDSNLQKGKWKIPPHTNGSNPLFSLKAKPYAIDKFLRYLLENQRQTGGTTTAYLNDLYDHYVEESIDDIQEQHLLTTSEEFRNLLTEYQEGILLFSIMELEVWNKASQDTAGLRKYYEGHKAKYTAGERARARLFSTTDKGFLDEIRKKISKGDTITRQDLKRFKSVQPFRNYARAENKVVDLTPWSVGLHEVTQDGIHYLVEIESLVPPGIKSFDDARAQTTSDYQEVLEKNWVASLKQKYPVKVNNRNKKSVITELTRP